MIKGVYRPSRIKNGKRVRSKFYRLVYRLDGMPSKAWTTLRTTDQQVAHKKAAEFLRDKERELHGLIPPQSVRDAAARPLLFQLSEFVSDLSAQGRDSMYVYNIERRVRRLLADCGWTSASQISADGFQRWRSTHRDKAPKIVNDYQDALAGFLKWLVRNKRQERNALDGVPKAQTRGKERRRRRAFSVHELNRLVSVSGERKVGYLLAALTGLRRAEIGELRWGDVHLDADCPFIAVRDSTTKNGHRAEIPLHPQLTRVLGEVRPEAVVETQAVLRRHHLASMWMFQKT
jgi:integrase